MAYEFTYIIIIVVALFFRHVPESLSHMKTLARSGDTPRLEKWTVKIVLRETKNGSIAHAVAM